jgi:hypothetical protein
MTCHLSQGGASTSDAMHASHVTNPREASPDESERDTWTSHGSMGPPECLRACLAGLRLLQKRLRLWLLRWSGFFDGAEAVLKNVWQNGFT